MAYRTGAAFINGSLAFRVLAHGTYLAVWWAIFLISKLIYRLRVQGRCNLRHARPAFLVSNHTLLLDPGILSMAILPFRTYFTMLEETALVPVLGTFVRLLDAVPIPEDGRQFRRFERELRRVLERRRFVHFFPEGECFRWSQEVQPFRRGVFLLACRLGIPVIPVATVLHGRFWNGQHFLTVFGRKIHLPPRVTVVVGRPIDPAAPGAKGRAGLREAAEALRLSAQARIQAAIDRKGGSRSIYRGQMPRIVRASARG